MKKIQQQHNQKFSRKTSFWKYIQPTNQPLNEKNIKFTIRQRWAFTDVIHTEDIAHKPSEQVQEKLNKNNPKKNKVPQVFPRKQFFVVVQKTYFFAISFDGLLIIFLRCFCTFYFFFFDFLVLLICWRYMQFEAFFVDTAA